MDRIVYIIGWKERERFITSHINPRVRIEIYNLLDSEMRS